MGFFFVFLFLVMVEEKGKVLNSSITEIERITSLLPLYRTLPCPALPHQPVGPPRRQASPAVLSPHPKERSCRYHYYCFPWGSSDCNRQKGYDTTSVLHPPPLPSPRFPFPAGLARSRTDALRRSKPVSARKRGLKTRAHCVPPHSTLLTLGGPTKQLPPDRESLGRGLRSGHWRADLTHGQWMGRGGEGGDIFSREL